MSVDGYDQDGSDVKDLLGEVSRLCEAVQYIGTIRFYELMLNTSAIACSEPKSDDLKRHKALVESFLKRVPPPPWMKPVSEVGSDSDERSSAD